MAESAGEARQGVPRHPRPHGDRINRQPDIRRAVPQGYGRLRARVERIEMPTPVKFEAKVINVQVKSKTIKEKTEDGMVYETTEKVGRMTLEFDGERTDVAALAAYLVCRPLLDKKL